MTIDIEASASLVVEGNKRALGRLLSLIENDDPAAAQVLEKIYPGSKRAVRIGITGAPGAGKSTMVNSLAAQLSKDGKRVAILAVDPSSPFSGGAVLGDRIRMKDASELEQVFVRSMASRGALGGLAPRTAESIHALEAAGYEYVIIETVGVGQAEVEVVKMSDTVVLVLVPGMGDGVQALKAGIIEIADIFAINKADYPGADRLEKELRVLMGLAPTSPNGASREAAIVRTQANQDIGIEDLIKEVEEHRAWAIEAGEFEKRGQRFIREAVLKRVAENLMNSLTEKFEGSSELDKLVSEIFERKKQVAEAAQIIGKETD